MPAPVPLESDHSDGMPQLSDERTHPGQWLYRPIVLDPPKRLVDPDSWVSHIPFAFWLVDVVRPQVLVELGTHAGTSYAAFAQAVQRLGLSTAAYAVDTWTGDSQAGFYDESVFKEWESYHASHFAAFSRLLRSTFDEAAGHFDDGTIDILHIDGCHTYEAVSADFARWRPKLSRRGVALFHDTNVRERDFGVWRFWEEIKDHHPCFEFLHGHGLGVLGVGPDQPAELRRLFAAAEGSADLQSVRAFFATLGGGILAGHHERVAGGRLQAATESDNARARQAETLRAADAFAYTVEVAQLKEQVAGARQEAADARQQAEAARQEALVAARDLEDRQQELNQARKDQSELEAAVEANERVRLRIVAEIEELRRRAAHAPAESSHSTRPDQGRAAIKRLQRKMRPLLRTARTPAALGLVPSRHRRWRPAPLAVLLSPARLRDALIIVASGLFDEAYYLATNPDVRARGGSALAHFVLSGGSEGRSPHALFDTDYYRRHNADVATASVNPLAHYWRFGVAEGRNPHPLFDLAYYRANNPDVAGAGLEPLTHFLRFGAREGRNPNPLFDCAYYLKNNPDVGASTINPLVHFVTDGWREGRRPSDAFDLDGYLAAHEDVAQSKQNPLSHYLEYGRFERPPLGAAEAERGFAALPVPEPPPAIMTSRSLAAANTAQPPTIVCLSHVMPVPPRAGNEYRILRMLRWLRDRGYRIVPVIAPLPGDEISQERIQQLAAEFSNAVVCERNGALRYILGSIPDTLASLNGDTTRPVSLLLDEDSIRGSHQQDLLRMDRTFCHDVLISAVTRLQQALGPHVLLAEYIWMTRILPLVGPDVLKVVDTIDVFSTKREKVLRFGVDDLHVDAAEEARRLRRADLIIAIQEDERRELSRLAPATPVVTAGVDFDVAGGTAPPEAPRVLYIASGNPMNRKGLDDFLRFAWPGVRQEVPGAELVLAGDVGASLMTDVPGVIRMGRVADLAPLYHDARVVINPAAAGTGVKIKTLEALGYFRSVVTWPSGVDGLPPELADLCHVVRDWYSFRRRLSSLLTVHPAPSFSPAQQELIKKSTAPEATYRALTDMLAQMVAQRSRTSAAGAEPRGLQGA